MQSKKQIAQTGKASKAILLLVVVVFSIFDTVNMSFAHAQEEATDTTLTDLVNEPSGAVTPTTNELSQRYVIFLNGIRTSASETSNINLDLEFGDIKTSLVNIGLSESRFVYFSYSAAAYLQVSGLYCWGWGPNGCSTSNFGDLASLNLSPVYSVEDTKRPIQEQANALNWLIGQIVQRDAAAQIDFVGYSLGGILASYWASQYGGISGYRANIHSLILIESPVGGLPFARECLPGGIPSQICPILHYFVGDNLLRELQLPDSNTGSIVGLLPQAARNFPLTSIQSLADYFVNSVSLSVTSGPLFLCFPVCHLTIGQGTQYWVNARHTLHMDKDLGGLGIATTPVPQTAVLNLLQSNHGDPLHHVQTSLWVIEAIQAIPLGRPNVLYASTATDLWHIDPVTGESAIIGPTGYVLSDIAFDGQALYGINFSQLLSVNPTTGASYPIGYIGYDDVIALAVAPNGTMYAGTGSGAFLRINKSTGAGTFFAQYGSGFHASGDLAISGNTMYATTTRDGYPNNDWLIKIDLNTKAVTPVGPIGFVGVCGIDFKDGVLYGVTCGNGYLLTINSTTGNGTLINEFFVDFWGLSTSPAAEPAPSALFFASPRSGNVPLAVDFQIVDTSNITSCFWIYGGGQTGTSCAPSHTHTYSNAGSYTVTLTVNGPGGTDSTIRTNYIVVSHIVTSTPPAYDFDGDGTTDVAVFRPSNGVWYVKDQFGVQFGANGDIPVAKDYNGDGITDVAVFRPSNGVWYVMDQFGVQFGANGDIPIPGDYNGDGFTDVAVFRPSNGVWYVMDQFGVQFGANGDIPVPGDYNGDGFMDVAVFRPSNGVWYVMDQFGVQFGANGDIPVAKDYNGDGITDVAVFRPSNGVWYVMDQFGVQFGANGDIPVPGDYNGDGFTDVAVFRPSNGVWYVMDQFGVQFGANGDIPVPSRP